MKLFWSLIALLVIAAGVVVFRPASSQQPDGGIAPSTSLAFSRTGPNLEVIAPVRTVTGGDGQVQNVQAEPAVTPAPIAKPVPDPVVDPVIEPEPTVEPASEAAPAPVAFAEVPADAPAVEPAIADEPASFVAQQPAAQPSVQPTAQPDAQADVQAQSEPVVAELEPEPEPAVDPAAAAYQALADAAAPASSSGAQPEPDLGVEAPAPAAAPVPGSFELNEDGSLVIVNASGTRTTVPGDGTPAAPYELDWRLLTSIQQTYAPDVGKTELPEWTAPLEGKHIRVTGHLLLPLVATGTSELLVMQNPWDGCCLGVPPTPYDAVEVRLTQALNIDSTWANYGTIEGTLTVDPYVVSGFLLGLYLINDASLVQASGVGSQGQ